MWTFQKAVLNAKSHAEPLYRDSRIREKEEEITSRGAEAEPTRPLGLSSEVPSTAKRTAVPP